MTTPRIAPLVEPLGEALASKMAKLIPQGMPAPQLFLSVARNESLFGFMVDSGLIGPTGLLDRRTLPRPIREAVILRTCVATQNDYEFNLHVQTISGRMGLTEEQIEDIKHPAINQHLWSAQQLASMQMVDALVNTLAIPDDVYANARLNFSDEELIDLTQLVGLYTGVAMLVGLIRPRFDRYRGGLIVRATP